MKTLTLTIQKFYFFIFVIALFNVYPSFSQELLYIHTDRSVYNSGDTLWFKSYNINETNYHPFTQSSFVNLVLFTYNGKKLKHQKYKYKNGTSAGYFAIPDSLKDGSYVLSLYSNLMQENQLNSLYNKEIKIIKNSSLDAFININLEKEVYKTGDSITGTVEAINKKKSRYANVDLKFELIQGESVINEVTLNSGIEGIVNFGFPFPQEISDKSVYIKATVIKSSIKAESIIPVLFKDTPPHIEFFPEGGYTLEGVENVIAFKALNPNGIPFDFSAEIVDKDGKLIKNISSQYQGMGKFRLKYSAEDALRCRITKPSGFDKSYTLPIPKKQSHAVEVRKDDNQNLLIKFKSNIDYNPDEVFGLILANRNGILIDKKLTFSQLDSFYYKVDKIPDGILKITVKAGDLPLTERICFIKKPNSVIKISNIKKHIGPKEKIEFSINLTQPGLKEKVLDLSMSVSSIDSKYLIYTKESLYSYLLFSNELKGNIPTPGFYFSEHPFSNYALDLVMLTHGWRKIVSDKKKDVYVSKNIKMPPAAIKGRVIKQNGKPVKAAEVVLMNFNTISVAKTSTDNSGYFKFSMIDYMIMADTSTLVLTASSNNNKVKLILEQPNFDTLSKFIRFNESEEKLISKKLIMTYLRKSWLSKDRELFNYQDTIYNPIMIKDVNVQEKQIAIIPKEVYEETFITRELGADDISRTAITSNGGEPLFLDLIRKVAGNFTYIKSGGKVLFRGANSIYEKNMQGAAIAVNGHLLGFDLRLLDGYNPQDVENIKVNKASGAGLKYTSFASGGLIEIKMKKNVGYSNERQTEKPKNMVSIDGFKINREFYIPKYETKKSLEKPDFRKTLFWKPTIQFNNEGKSKISFYASDIQGFFLVNIQGINKNGEPIYITKNFKVE